MPGSRVGAGAADGGDVVAVQLALGLVVGNALAEEVGEERLLLRTQGPH